MIASASNDPTGARVADEIASLEDAIDVLEAWPADQRGLAHETLMRACQEEANGRFPVAAIQENLETFLRKAGVLADIEDVPHFAALKPDRNIGSA